MGQVLNRLAAPPGPPSRTLFGHLFEFRRDPLGFFTRCAREYGDIVRYRIGPATAYLVSHPDLVEQVLVHNAHNFVKGRVIHASRQVLGEGLFTSEGDAWLHQRRQVQPAFHRTQINAYVQQMVGVTEHELAGWAPGETFNLSQRLNDLTRGIATRTLIRADIDEQATEIGQVIGAVWEGLNARMSNGLLIPAGVPTPGHLRLARNLRRLDKVIYRIIDQRRADGRVQDDLLAILLQSRDPAGQPLTSRQLRDQVLTLFLAGHETTYLAISWAWFLLGRHPEAEEKLRLEARRVFSGRSPTDEDLPRLAYTEKVVWEALRLYPTAWAIPRLALHDYDLGGYRLPAGSSVTMSQWVIQRDPRFFEQPEAFRPERWTPEFIRQLPAFAFFPFGGGPRKCIGHSFGMTEAILVTAIMAARVKLTPVPGQQVVPWPLFSLRLRNGYQVTLRDRDLLKPDAKSLARS